MLCHTYANFCQKKLQEQQENTTPWMNTTIWRIFAGLSIPLYPEAWQVQKSPSLFPFLLPLLQTPLPFPLSHSPPFSPFTQSPFHFPLPFSLFFNPPPFFPIPYPFDTFYAGHESTSFPGSTSYLWVGENPGYEVQTKWGKGTRYRYMEDGNLTSIKEKHI